MIGKSNNLKRRTKELFKTIKRKNYYAHTEGGRFKKLNLNEIITDLKIRYRYEKTDEDAKRIENLLLKEYQWIFGELPPLNNSGGY